MPLPKAFVALAVALSLPFGARPQDHSANVTGIVTDPKDAAVPSAVVTLTHIDQGLTRTTTTNDRGVYDFRFVPIGRYSLRISKPGFKEAGVGPFDLTVGQTARLDFRLDIGEITQSVEVPAAAEILQSETSEVSQVIYNKQVTDLPLNGRNFDDLIPLSAGVTNGGQRSANTGYNLNGSRTDQNLFLIDGQDNVDMNNNLIIRPSIDAIEEFRIQTGTFSAEYGRAAGGVVSVVLKSGTNQFHGSAFEFLRNEKLDANNFFDNQVPLQPGQTKAQRSSLRRNQFGGTLGGPIYRSKTFFFVDYQGTREIAGKSTIQSVPTIAERQGDFSRTLRPGQNLFQNALLGAVYPGQKIPASQLDPAAVKLANLYPLPNQPGVLIPGQGTINNFAIAGNSTADSDQFDVKIDHRLAAPDTLSGHYTFGQSDQSIPAAFGSVGPCIGCGVVLDLLAGSPNGRNQNAGISETHLFKPAVVNQFRIGVARTHSFYQTSDGGKNLASEIGIKNVNVSPLTTGLPWFYFTPSPSWIGTSPFTPSVNGYTNWQLTEIISFLIGRHSFKAGYEMHRRDNDGAGNFFGKGAYIFAPFFTGNAFGDFMTGRALVLQQDLYPGTVGWRGKEFGWFIQDDFKVSARLTLNMGIRYDIFPGNVEAHDRVSNLNPLQGTVILAGKNGAPRNFLNTDYNNLGPRFGFAYALDPHKNTVMRGGYGISYVNFNNVLNYAGLNPPYTRAFNLVNLSPTFDAQYKISDGLPVQLAPTPENFNPNNPSGSFRQLDPHARTPYTQYFSFNIGRVLPGNMGFEIGYVGTKGTKLPGEVEGNPAPPGDPSTTEQRRIHHGTIPNVGSITYYINGFSSIYHSLQAKLEKRLSYGLQFLTTYTYSKSIDNKSGSAVTGGSDSNPSSKPENPFDWNADRGLSSFDRRHRFVTAFNYELPFGAGRKFGGRWNAAANGILGGWQLNGVVSLSSGLPFNVFASSAAQCGCSAGELRPDRIKDGRLPDSQRSVHQWFDKTAFVDPPASTAAAPGRYGTAGRNIIPGPNFRNLDLSLFKRFPLGEGREIQLRGEFFNVFNHANFLYPTSTANAAWTSGGILTAALPPRIGQVAVKILF
jgi:hypothetical protein